jgi:GTP pyrophosphokinase
MVKISTMYRVRINDIIDKLLQVYSPEEISIVNKAYIYSAKVHQGQTRLSGEPYLVHPITVAKILTDMNMDVPTIVTGLLHDVVEDTYTTIEEIEKMFGKEIAILVDGVTKISKLEFKSKQQKVAENFRKLIVATTNDIRVIIVKLADRLHNMRTLEFMPESKQVAIAQETLDIYAPLANRLGISWIKSELEDLSLKYLKPAEYENIRKKIEEIHGEKDKYINEVIKIIRRNLDYYKIEGEISGRLKHFYSIYKKMVKRNIDISQIYDILAFRIIVKTVQDCYQVLGIIHSLWKPIPGRFKDFIAMPKSNMYQSLHTTVIGPFGDFIEIQIRTEEMHKIAEEGIAAHWLYKENKTKDDESFKVFNWLRQVMELKDDIGDANQFFSTVKSEVLSDSVYVFTPAGELIELPLGATPIDFAYAIHTGVGNKCIGAKVNGAIVPLRYQLQTGDRVEIITSKNAKPNKDWLQFVKTSKARNKIRQFIKKESFDANVSIGKALLEKALAEHKLEIDNIKKDKELLEVAKDFNFVDIDTFLASIGYGKISPKQVVNRLLPEDVKKKEIKTHKTGKTEKSFTGVVIDDESNYMVNFGKCCNPLPGEDIIGFITRGKGVTVHSVNCKNIPNLDPERLINVKWDESNVGKRIVKLKVIAKDRKGLLLEMTNVISDIGLNMTNVHIDTTEDGRAISYFYIEMKSSSEYKILVNRLHKVPGVLTVEKA